MERSAVGETSTKRRYVASSSFSSSDPSVAQVVGSRVYGQSAGSATISASGGAATLVITVDATEVTAQLVELQAMDGRQARNLEKEIQGCHEEMTHKIDEISQLDDERLDAATVMSAASMLSE